MCTNSWKIVVSLNGDGDAQESDCFNEGGRAKVQPNCLSHSEAGPRDNPSLHRCLLQAFCLSRDTECIPFLVQSQQ